MKNISLLLLLLSSHFLQAQTTFQRMPYDHIWVLNNSYIDFNTSPPQVIPHDSDMKLELTNACISDEMGQLLFYSNNLKIYNAAHHPLSGGGDTINYNSLWQYFVQNNRGYASTQYNIALPIALHKYILISSEADWAEENLQRALSLRYSIIDFSTDFEGQLTEKEKMIIADTLDVGKISSVRHANGRDWWVVIPEEDKNNFYRLLITPDSVYQYAPQVFANATPSGVGQVKFSPRGDKYASLNMVNIGGDQYINIFDFDRCSGLFSNPIQFTYRDTAFMGGLEFSDNGRFLYVPSFGYLYQYDLLAEDIEESQVLLKKVSEEDYKGFSLAQLAPDGKIYLSSQGSMDSLHIIHRPNLPFPHCEFDYLGLPLPELSWRTLPNFPYYGLGPLDGSPCDTLGIDNPAPTAAYEYLLGDTAALAVSFYDASHFADSWLWDFGDASASSDQRFPVHAYAAEGVYTVCLTATNLTGSDSFCQDIYVGTTTTASEPAPAPEVHIYPNPTSGLLYLEAPQGTTGQVCLLDANGTRQLTSTLNGGERLSLDTSALPQGMYLVQIRNNKGESLWVQRVVIVR